MRLSSHHWLIAAFVFGVGQAASYASDFIRVSRSGFTRGGKPYTFIGANFWIGMNLGSDGPAGDRARLVRELDRLASLGVRNLRVLAASEGPDAEPWRISPALQAAPGKFDERLLRGLDFLLSEMRKRDLTAVICLTNFWPWSGGMAQFVRWNGGGEIPYPPPAPGGDWNRFQNYSATFYANARAMAAFQETIRAVVSRRNSISGILYGDDPSILAWQLANEPRGAGHPAAFQAWIGETARFIKSLDPNHLVTTGSEGETPSARGNGMDFFADHAGSAIDYATIHIWVQNWGIYDPMKAAKTFPKAVDYMKAYLEDHLRKAERLGKPVVLEEFGISRDGNSYDPASTVVYRDRYYREVFEATLRSIRAGRPLAGANFWAWAGEAQPIQPFGSFWKPGQPLIGDPPHENQGWYSVYSTDRSTVRLIEEYAEKLARASRH